MRGARPAATSPSRNDERNPFLKQTSQQAIATKPSWLSWRRPVRFTGTFRSAMCVLHVSGAVERPLEIGRAELDALADVELVSDFHCREGWSRRGERWRGVRLATLLAHAGAGEDGRYVTVASGEYRAVLTREQAGDARVLLALERNGHPLERSDGLPRLVGPAEWDCFLGVKAVDRIQVTREPEQATAETIALARLRR